MASRQFDIISIGDCSVDHFVMPSFYSIGRKGKDRTLNLEYSAKIPAQKFKLFAGGNALNTAVSFSRLGLKAAIVTTIGADIESEMILEALRSQQIYPNFVTKDKSATTDKSVILVTRGERTVISYHCSKKYNVPGSLLTKWIYLTSLGEHYKSVYSAVTDYRKKKGVKVAYNPGSRQLVYAMPQVRRILRSVDALFVNYSEAKMVARAKLTDIKKLLTHLSTMGAKQVFITNGKKGAYGYDGSDIYRVGIYPVERVDATGAGDAFASAATAALLLGKGMAEAMRWGAVNSAFEVSEVGVQNGLLSRRTIVDILRRESAPKCRKV